MASLQDVRGRTILSQCDLAKTSGVAASMIGNIEVWKGSHTFWQHELIPEVSISLSGGDGEDAHLYQEKDVRTLIAAVRTAKERSE